MAMQGDQTQDEPMEIDDSLYSRQRYVLGDSAMQKMAQSSVFISGMGGLGVEIAKNVILAGIKSVTIHDQLTATMMDLSSQFFLREEDVKTSKNRAEASCQQLKDLNPYVDVNFVTFPLDMTFDLSYLTGYQCVVFTDASFDLLNRINQFCRSQQPPIKFIAGSVRGVACYGFCDFGDNFTVFDKTGEDPIEFFISKISQENPAVVSCLENERHGLEDGDVIQLSEVVGMREINERQCEVKVLGPSKFSINVDTRDYSPYQYGGLVRQVKITNNVQFQPLSQELCSPTYQLVDFAKIGRPPQLLLFFKALDCFIKTHGTCPQPRILEDALELCKLAEDLNQTLHLVDSVDTKLLQQLAYTTAGLLPPLATTLGGILAQECLIAVTGKFSPLKQWLFLDATELLQEHEVITTPSSVDRYEALRICLGDKVLKQLASLRLFMVGCGAIGCEMLKGYAMLGVGQAAMGGKIVITDNDIIEKSNLNRQFLFRPQHIQQHKSVIAAASTKYINPDVDIEAQCYKGTEHIYNDAFFSDLNLIVNALDNLEARRYVDSRCVTNLRPLLESGTLGTKGHVQVIIPEQTESYSSQQDPPEREVPYCTLKSFPATIEHTIQWARDKFESLWSQKPAMYSKFWQTHNNPAALLKVMEEHQLIPDGSIKVIKLFINRPHDWKDCVTTARVKFEKYFKHKALNLLTAFPLDTKMPDGSLFWQSPKRPPTVLEFSGQNQMHVSFLTSYARLYAEIWGIKCTEQDLTIDNVLELAATADIPEFRPSGKRIETDESAKRPEVIQISNDEIEICLKNLKDYLTTHPTPSSECLTMFPQSFEKDNDSNGHIDFITASSNLRAIMYNIETADRFKTKRIAGRIVPAIATTTAAVAGLVSLELIKVAMTLPLENYKNAFMNLALPEMPLLLSEPASAPRTIINGDISYTLWTRWEVKGRPDMTLKEFLETVKVQYRLEPTMVVLGVKMIYVPLMPGHRKRLPQLMKTLLKAPQTKEYVDLTLSFENDKQEDVPGPPVRYYF